VNVSQKKMSGTVTILKEQKNTEIVQEDKNRMRDALLNDCNMFQRRATADEMIALLFYNQKEFACVPLVGPVAEQVVGWQGDPQSRAIGSVIAGRDSASASHGLHPTVVLEVPLEPPPEVVLVVLSVSPLDVDEDSSAPNPQQTMSPLGAISHKVPGGQRSVQKYASTEQNSGAVPQPQEMFPSQIGYSSKGSHSGLNGQKSTPYERRLGSEQGTCPPVGSGGTHMPKLMSPLMSCGTHSSPSSHGK
jgi:hypothetical protein